MALCTRCRKCSFNLNSDDCERICTDGRKLDLENEIECDGFNSKYIEYPIEVSKIERSENDRGITESLGHKTGALVGVRPCNEKYGGKTYVGFLIGDIDTGLLISHNPETKVLHISRHYNPAIFVPELGEIIYGCESWWSEISSVEKLKSISDDDINNQWYVKALKKLTEKGD